jgi:hypothetical protein
MCIKYDRDADNNTSPVRGLPVGSGRTAVGAAGALSSVVAGFGSASDDSAASASAASIDCRALLRAPVAVATGEAHMLHAAADAEPVSGAGGGAAWAAAYVTPVPVVAMEAPTDLWDGGAAAAAGGGAAADDVCTPGAESLTRDAGAASTSTGSTSPAVRSPFGVKRTLWAWPDATPKFVDYGRNTLSGRYGMYTVGRGRLTR